MDLPCINNIVVATVTYGERFNFLEKVIESVLLSGITKIVVIDNGCPYSVEKKIAEQFSDIPSITVSKLEKNNGSAEGFYQAIKIASDIENCDYIMLLDDDNVLECTTIQKIVNNYQLLNDPMASLLCLREDRKEYVEASRTGSWNNALANSFQSFHVSKLLTRRLEKEDVTPLVPIEYAPYGGFIFNKAWVDSVGYPDLSYGLYGDDHEYTYRISQASGKLYLASLCKVVDIEQSWYLNDDKTHRFFMKNIDKKRLELSLKNRVKFEKKNLLKNRPIYIVNMFIYLSLNCLVSMKGNVFAFKELPSLIRVIWSAYNEK